MIIQTRAMALSYVMLTLVAVLVVVSADQKPNILFIVADDLGK